ncbi:MAG: CDP-glucose 4,6-dehydratase [Bacteroidetes bacterium RIFOXYA12_FULL_35_11]|nr:MAG: CDP-glucose 4,6-dehydratase [Bacteroidetes bacterium GWF2_35_48]OFY73080.1 MAG: CDP-glucose 4,6-dehydratase [Bacteroidetes bacterium RIFOXYA12_FULL_35_11]OFY94642.1 MAG: CDP-glucose 4,6-dehydratase [Bacteroidetes bacterium RIFOXYC12_FULL_35_7]OFY97438.1 MAG: CDP-glucose 4,6-dehydratase [Bacteroidetes bacterium RIFOXYB2_FULL_35_7]HBX53531.1 CDP-glucose 4,6-dehydratase [Bacteroidales bacterium]
MINNFNDAYRGKTVLVTGHTGFKGSWLSIWLKELGAKVVGYALDPFSDKDNFVLSNLSSKIIDVRGDIRDRKKLNEVFKKYSPDIVFHLAAQPLVRISYENPVETYETNVIGTINILEEIRNNPSTKIGIIITTDKCYDNKEQLWGYKENDAMGGYDPYSSSKGAAELAINSWRLSFMNPVDYTKHRKSIASVRAGNVVGGGDWAKDRIIPDCIRAIEMNLPIEIRSPDAIRPWEHVLEALSGYLLLGEKMLFDPLKYCQAWNFGPELKSIVSVWNIAELIVKSYGKGMLKDVSDSLELHEAKILALDISKAKFLLGWSPRLDIHKTIELTVDWYKKYFSFDTYDLCVDQIKIFQTTGSDIILSKNIK